MVSRSSLPYLAITILLFHTNASAGRCEDILPLRLPDVRVTEAIAVADSSALTGRVKVPHCKVSGVIGREIRFEAYLPDSWNNRFFMGGGGGYVGRVSNSAIGTVNRG
jgi:hypothetical protein